MSIHDDAFWDQVPAEHLRTLVEQGRSNGLLTSLFALGDPFDLGTPGIAVIQGAPGNVFPRHCHDTERFEVLVAGSFRDGTGRTFGAGDVMVAHHMDMYGPHIGGPEGYTVVELFDTMLGTYELFWDTPKGPRRSNKLLEEAPATPEPVMRGTSPPASERVVRGAAHESIHDPAFWNRVPSPRLQPLVDAVEGSGFPGMAYRLVALGDPDDPEVPAAVMFKAPAGYVLPRHSHDCHRFEVLIDGSILDERGETRAAGSVMTAEPGQMYGPYTAGPSGYCSVELFSRLAGAYEITWETARGPWLDNRLAGSGSRPA
jgi:anti-sigma factor ChrR (cupin superfamily)